MSENPKNGIPEVGVPGPEDPTSGGPDVVRPSRRTVLGVGALSAVALLGTGALAGPRPARLGAPTGNQDLAAELADHLTGQRTVACALIDGDDVRFAGFGTDEHREFEVGSVSKTFTAALVMDAVRRGELELEATVQDVLGASAKCSAIPDVTVRDLASHTSGIPSLPAPVIAKNLWRTPLHRDPYAGFGAQEVVDLALDVTPVGRGSVAYSNHGVALEGQLVARAAGASWPELLAERVLTPMGLTATRAPITASRLGAKAPTGFTGTGHRSAAWTMDGFAPAGGIRSTAADLVTWVRSMMDGSNAGADGIRPTARQDEKTSVGVNWFTTTLAGGGRAVWHNGETGGFHSFCGFSPEAKRGWVLLSDTADSGTDDLAFRILDGEVAA
ncbi:beta-lactamase family protein [Brachybacterium sp. MASK1Z-5]|uniref:Beta-lactamase n=1 Tax=Brachybacterium halotolerans TaxID=2795215 RepID=A0ABS1BCE6_9MICO|nr:serine hydrolase domain-containing protein [Brachybacterium halotolerans]MBK0332310.1 beta-lactamase family protein [Brachybacterium halotolerans]